MTFRHPAIQEQDRSTIPACRSRLNRFRHLACGALLLAAAASGGAATVDTAAAQSFQPPIANLPIHTPIEYMSAGEAQIQLGRIIDNNLTALRHYDDEGLCRIFRVFTQTDQLNATEDLLNSLARKINRLGPHAGLGPQAGRQAAQDVANYVRRVSALIRGTKCPPDRDFQAGTGRTVGSTVPRQAPADEARSAREPKAQPLTAEELRNWDTSDLLRGARRARADGRRDDLGTIRAELRGRASAEFRRGLGELPPVGYDPDPRIILELNRDRYSHEAGDGDAD